MMTMTMIILYACTVNSKFHFISLHIHKQRKRKWKRANKQKLKKKFAVCRRRGRRGQVCNTQIMDTTNDCYIIRITFTIFDFVLSFFFYHWQYWCDWTRSPTWLITIETMKIYYMNECHRLLDHSKWKRNERVKEQNWMRNYKGNKTLLFLFFFLVFLTSISIHLLHVYIVNGCCCCIYQLPLSFLLFFVISHC